MKKTLMGFIIGILFTTSFFIFVGAAESENDSLKSLLLKIEEYMDTELNKQTEIGRYQLQSFNIDRTHWHYLLDTSTGELYRLEPSRSPENSKWTLMSAANFEKP